jgi:GAF domain-containing protein
MTQYSTEGTIVPERPVTGASSLRTRLIIANGVITFLAIFALGYYVYFRLQQSNTFLTSQLDASVRQQAQDYMSSTSATQANVLNTFFVTLRQNLGVLGSTTNSLLAKQGSASLEAPPSVTLHRLPNGSWDNTNGDIAAVFIPGRYPSADAIMPELNALKPLDDLAPQIRLANPDAVAIYFGGPSGETVYYPNIDLATIVPPDFDVTQRPWYLAAAPSNNPQALPVWSAPYLDAASHGLVMTVSVPVFDAARSFRGVVAMDIQLQRISALVANAKVGQTGYAMVLDRDGRVIAMPPAAYKELGISEEALPLGEVLDPAKTGARLPANFLSTLKGLTPGTANLETIQVGGVDHFMGHQAIPEVGYTLITLVPSDELLASVSSAKTQAMRAATDTLQISLVLVLVILLAALLATFVLSNTLTSPLVRLTQTAEEIAGGNLNAHTSIGTRDEIGVLSRTLNSMTSALRGLIESLEQRVRDRTAALEVASRQANRRAAQFEAVTQVTRAISAIRNVGELMPRVASVISTQFGYYHVGIFLNDEPSQQTYLIAANSEGGRRMLARRHRLKIGEQGIVGHVAATGEERVARVVGEDRVFFENPDLPTTQSEAALPLRTGGKVLGVLDVQSTAEDAFTPEDIEILKVLADQVSLAIDNTRLFETTQRSLLDVETLYRQYVRNAWERLSREEDITGFRYSTLGAMPMHGTGKDAAIGSRATSPLPAANALKVPIKLRGEVIGDLIVEGPTDTDWSQDEIDLVQAVADRVALSAENARLFDETTRRAERERLVTEITSRIRGSNDPQAMIRTALDELKNALGATHIQIIPQDIPESDTARQAIPANAAEAARRRPSRNGAAI